jgi:uncharacterized protein YlxW (UPF0749 family)
MRRSRTLLALACLAIGFLAATAVRIRPVDPSARLPESERLAALIQREQKTTESLRQSVAELRRKVTELQVQTQGRQQGSAERTAGLQQASLQAGLRAMRGPGIKVTLDDSDKEDSPSGNVNDLVIHSQDVQAVVNAVWRAGAEAVAINGQRLVSTSAVLCVGNTLLLNGTVHSPPYVISAVGTSRERFEADHLVKRLRDDAKSFGLRFSVSRENAIDLPAFTGATSPHFARPV